MGEADAAELAAMTAMLADAMADGAFGIATALIYPPGCYAGTGLTSCLPPWAEADGKLWENLRHPETRSHIRREMLAQAADWENLGAGTGPNGVVLAGLQRPEHRQYLGRRLADVTAERQQEWVDTALDLLDAEGQNIFCFYFEMSEENLRLQMQQPWMKFSTDAGGVDPERLGDRGLLHPRAFGTYPRVLGRYVRHEGLLPLEDAIRKMKSAVADRLFLRDRGLLRQGMKADVVLFDPETISDNATFEKPHQFSTGVRDVWVNGVRVLNTAVHTGATPGRWLRGPGAS